MTTRGPSLVVTLHYLGPPGTYSHQVAQQISQRLYLNKIKSSPPSTSAPEGRDFLIDLKPCETIKQTLKTAQSSLTDLENVSLALLPYENNTNGPVAESFDIVRRDIGFRIVADDFLPVSHSLLVSRRAFDVLRKESNCGKSGQIESNARNSRLEVMSRLKAVCSHPQALGQCNAFIEKQLPPNIRRIETSSTGQAAYRIATQTNSSTGLEACIASQVCVQPEVYDLFELQSNIQDSSHNVTRFLLVEAVHDNTKSTKVSARPGRADHVFRTLMRVSDKQVHHALNAIASFSDHKFTCHLRKIDRMTDRESVPKVAASSHENVDGVWPALYVVEVDFVRKGNKKDWQSDDSHDVQHLIQRFGPSARCLGVWMA